MTTFTFRRHHFLSALPFVAGGVLLGTIGSANAQKAPATAKNPAPSVVAAPVAVPAAPNIKILLLAIDELPAPGVRSPHLATPADRGADAIVPAPLAPTPVAPDAIVPAPIVPVPGAPAPPSAKTPAIAPMLAPAGGVAVSRQPVWIVQAQKKKKVDKDADLFRLEPEPNRVFPRKPQAPDAPLAAPSLVPQIPQEPLGRARLAALPLRDALLAFGWRDVALAAPDATLVTDALSERRLTPHTLDALKEALAQLAAPDTVPSPEVKRNATLAATRIGQALGYRAVVVLHVAPASLQDGAQSAGFSLILADSARENGEPILFDEQGVNELALRQAGASTAAALLDKTLRTWPDVSAQSQIDLAATHLTAARALLAAGNVSDAQDELNQTIALDSSKGEPFVLLGDLLAATDAAGAAKAYRRAVELDARDGATLAKIAVAYSSSTVPDWPRALDAGTKALATGFDSVPLRVALATAQFGRADLFRKAERRDRAEDAEFDARKHLDRALELAPDDPTAVRLLARELVNARRFKEATQTLDRIAPRYPADLEIQTQYALALGGQIGREEDAFVAYARVWKLSGVPRADVDAIKYRALIQGFDARLYNLGKSAVQLTTGVANAALPREDALLQLTKLKEDMDEAQNAIGILRPPTLSSSESPAARQFAAGLMNQSLEQQQIFLETGQPLARLRGSQLYAQAVGQLNAARGGR
ncbi:tetratricopeptide repeat protein [Abditibacterium utsteinense]|uniref:tetratricopeptide repeat protein n=1 Tax=Abditibacterium utsteinense TaxID=1960156 RepID=UPI001474214F|nr:tetratricopeptide repeat protein [Abditibacterium utsteinense]